MRCVCRFLLVSMIVLFGLAALGAAARADAAERVYIDITQPFFQRLPVAVPDLKVMTGGDVQVAKDGATTLARDLELSGLFRPLDPSGFLEDPQKMGLTEADINFPSWRRAGADYLARGG